MNNDILCIYYSRTGNTKRVMSALARSLDCELVSVRDRVRRQGVIGWLRCGFDAVRKSTGAIGRFQTRQPLSSYRLVVIGTPVWAGRCSSVIRALLKQYGSELGDVAYVITHASEEPYRAVFDQMDGYLKKPHVADVSLQPGSQGYDFWCDQFLKTVADYVGCKPAPFPEGEDAPEAERPTTE